MDVIRLGGTDAKLYGLVAPLVMSPPVLRQNNNYPFKTGMRYVWYVALEAGTVCGFMPVRKKSDGDCIIDNYYIKGDDAAVLDRLLSEVLAACEEHGGAELWATVHKRHAEHFGRNGFRTCVEWKKYEKMRYCPKLEALCTG